MGVSARGAIVIVRYGQIFRGVKSKIAYEHGAVGCLIYSDPQRRRVLRRARCFRTGRCGRATACSADRWRISASGCRRSADDRHRRRARRAADCRSAKSPILTKIPVLPISYGDAQPLLAAMGGPMAPEAWRGALPIPYRLGAGPAKVHLKVAFNWDTKPLYDVIAKIPGSTFPGRVDHPRQPSRRLGERRAAIRSAAWRPSSKRRARWANCASRAGQPKRTIVYASWDGEEPGLLGSTEWVETHEADLRRARRRVHQHRRQRPRVSQHAAARIRSSGSSTASRATSAIPNRRQRPETPAGALRSPGARPTNGKEARERADLRIGALGSGSDYTPFVQHAGIASINLSFGDEDEDGIYHSIYDDFYFYTHFLDTDFAYGRALAQTVGTAVIRLADADVVPMEFTGSRGHRPEVRARAEGAARQEAGRHPRTQSADRRRRVRGDARSAGAGADSEDGGRAAGDQLRAVRQRRRRADRRRAPVRQGAWGRRARRSRPTRRRSSR